MKLELVTKRHKKNTKTSKKIDDDVLLPNCGVIVFFQFIATLQSSGSQILKVWPIKLTFSLTITFYLTKPENKTKTSLLQLSCYSYN